jgi:hypothetical protein
MRLHATRKNLAAGAPDHEPGTCKSPSNRAALCFLLTPLEATLRSMPASVDSKPVTEILNSLDATLTKNTGEGGTVMSELKLRPPIVERGGTAGRASRSPFLQANLKGCPAPKVKI